MTSQAATSVTPQVLPLTLATPESFARYGQIVMADADGLEYGAQDAQLDLSRGTPRFYAMRLPHRGLRFHSITRHRAVTQCLGSMHGIEWLLAVAAPNDASERPDLATLMAFRIPGDRIVKLERGAWHAGPFFQAESALFYNLELADTNVTDHQSCDLRAVFGLEFEFAAA